MKTLGTVCALVLLVAFSACQKKEEAASDPAASASPPEAPKTETDKAGAPPAEPAAPAQATDDKAPEGTPSGADKTGVNAGSAKVEKTGVSAGDTKVDKDGVKVGGTGVTAKKTGSGTETNVGGGVKVTTGADGKKKVNIGGLQIAK